MTEITITIRNKKPKPQAQNQPGAGGIIQSFRSRKNGRRRISSTGRIRFYDLGQIFIDEQRTDLDFSLVTAQTGDTDSGVNFANLDSSDFAERNDFYLESELTEFAPVTLELGHQLKIEISGNDFAQTTEPENERWTANGLFLYDDELAATNFKIGFNEENEFFEKFILTGEDKNHITSEPEFESDAVDFTPGASDIYFLIPSLFYAQYKANITIPGYQTPPELPTHQISADVTDYYLNYFYMPRPRNFESELEWSAEDGSFPSELLALALSRSAARMYIHLHQITSTDLVLGTGTTIRSASINSSSPGSFPTGSAQFVSYSQTNPLESALLAIIQQGNNFFYAWEN